MITTYPVRRARRGALRRAAASTSRPRRGAGDQERAEPGPPRARARLGRASRLPDGHAGGEPPGRALVDLRLARAGPPRRRALVPALLATAHRAAARRRAPRGAPRARSPPYVLRRLKRDVAKRAARRRRSSRSPGRARTASSASSTSPSASPRTPTCARRSAPRASRRRPSPSSTRSPSCARSAATRASSRMDAARPVGESAKLDALLELARRAARGRAPRPRLLAVHEHAGARRRRARTRARVEHLVLTGADARPAARGRRVRGGPGRRLPHQPQGRRHGAEPHERRHGHPLRPVVEPGGAGAGDGPRLPHRAARPVFVHNLYVAGSVEERVLALQQQKRWLSTTLLGDAAGAARWARRRSTRCSRRLVSSVGLVQPPTRSRAASDSAPPAWPLFQSLRGSAPADAFRPLAPGGSERPLPPKTPHP